MWKAHELSVRFKHRQAFAKAVCGRRLASKIHTFATADVPHNPETRHSIP